MHASEDVLVSSSQQSLRLLCWLCIYLSVSVGLLYPEYQNSSDITQFTFRISRRKRSTLSFAHLSWC